LQQEGKIDDAIQHYEAALKLKPDDAGTHSNLQHLPRSGGEVTAREMNRSFPNYPGLI